MHGRRPIEIHPYLLSHVVSQLDELAKEQEKLKIAQEDAKKLENELNRVTDECNGYRAAAAFGESSQKEELVSLHNKYQEEIASLQHIMSGK